MQGKKGYNPSKLDYKNGESLDMKLQQKIDNTKNTAMNDINNIFLNTKTVKQGSMHHRVITVKLHLRAF